MIMIFSWIKLLISVISTEEFYLKLSYILGCEYQFGLQKKTGKFKFVAILCWSFDVYRHR